MEIAIIGKSEVVLGFKALGCKTFPVSKTEEVVEVLKEIQKDQKYGIIFITENWFSQVKDQIKEFEEFSLPTITPLPDHKGTTGVGLKNISKIIEKAIGSDILG